MARPRPLARRRLGALLDLPDADLGAVELGTRRPSRPRCRRGARRRGTATSPSMRSTVDRLPHVTSAPRGWRTPRSRRRRRRGPRRRGSAVAARPAALTPRSGCRAAAAACSVSVTRLTLGALDRPRPWPAAPSPLGRLVRARPSQPAASTSPITRRAIDPSRCDHIDRLLWSLGVAQWARLRAAAVAEADARSALASARVARSLASAPSSSGSWRGPKRRYSAGTTNRLTSGRGHQTAEHHDGHRVERARCPAIGAEDERSAATPARSPRRGDGRRRPAPRATGDELGPNGTPRRSARAAGSGRSSSEALRGARRQHRQQPGDAWPGSGPPSTRRRARHPPRRPAASRKAHDGQTPAAEAPPAAGGRCRPRPRCAKPSSRRSRALLVAVVPEQLGVVLEREVALRQPLSTSPTTAPTSRPPTSAVTSRKREMPVVLDDRRGRARPARRPRPRGGRGRRRRVDQQVLHAR